MAKSIEVDININNNTEATIANLKALKRQLKETAAGSEDFNKISAQIRDMDDAIKDASATSDDFLGYLENASGPLGVLGTGIRSAEKNFSSFNAVLKASIIGLIVAAVGGLVAAFNNSETAMKKLEPVFIAFEKILGGIMKVFEPLLDMFIELALKVLPFITKGIGGFYSGLFALFTLLKNVGMGAGNILKGIFTLDFDAIKEGYNQLTGSWGAAVKDFEATNKRFAEGTREQTKTEKANSKERVENRKAEKKQKDEIVDAELLKLREFQGEYENYLKQIADLEKQYTLEAENTQAESEQQKLNLWYRRQKEEIDRITKAGGERNNLYALLEIQRAAKQEEINKKAAEEEQKILDARLAAQLAFVDALQGVLQGIGALFAQGSAEAKAFALLDIAVGTAKGFIQGLDIAQKSAAATGPGAAFAFPIFYAQQIGAVLAAAGRAKSILASSTASSAGGGTTSAPSAPQAPSFNVVGNSGANQIAQTIGRQSQSTIKAYVVSKDVTTQQALDRNIVKSATLG
jgi:hypothetical protein